MSNDDESTETSFLADVFDAAVEAVDGAVDTVADTAADAYDTASEYAGEAYDAASEYAGQAYDAAGDYLAENAVPIQNAINSVSDTTGVKVDLDGSDGNIGVKVDTSVVKGDVVDDEVKGFTASGEIKIDAGEAGKYGVKGNVGFDADGDLNAAGGGATVYVPFEGVLIGGEAEGGWSNANGTDSYTAGYLIGVEKDGLAVKEGFHGRYDESDDGDFKITVGHDAVVGFEDSNSKAGVEAKLTEELSYGEQDGNTIYGAKAGVEVKATVNNIDVAKIGGDVGVSYSTGVDGDLTTYQANAQGQLGNTVYTPTAQGTANVTHVTGTDANGNVVDRTSYDLAGKADADGLGVHLSGATGGTFDDVAAPVRPVVEEVPEPDWSTSDQAIPDPIVADPIVADPIVPDAAVPEPIVPDVPEPDAPMDYGGGDFGESLQAADAAEQDLGSIFDGLDE